VDGEPAEHVDVGVDQPLALDHRPVLVEILEEVVAPVEFDGSLVLGGGLLPPAGSFQPTASLVASVELVYVGLDLNGWTQMVVTLLEEDVVYGSRRRTAAQ
jgi:hypothetical protein